MTDEEFRAIIAAGPAVVMVESRHMIALLDERDGLREALRGIAANAAMPGDAVEQRRALWRMARAALTPEADHSADAGKMIAPEHES
jgi:hypothetical protein